MKRIKLRRKVKKAFKAKRVRLLHPMDTVFLVKRNRTGETIKRFTGLEGLTQAREFIAKSRTLYITTLPADYNAPEQFVSVPEPLTPTQQFHLVDPLLLGSRR